MRGCATGFDHSSVPWVLNLAQDFETLRIFRSDGTVWVTFKKH